MRCVISQMRTGSTMYAEMISGGNDHNSLYALGTCKLHGTEIPNREIFEFYYNDINKINSRFETFKQLTHRPTIKIIPGLVKTSIIEWCIQNLDCVFLNRKNKMDQIVSYGIAKYSSQWFNQNNKHLEPQCMEYLRPDFDYLISTINEFNKLAKLNKNIPMIFYEDIEVHANPMIPLKNKQRGLEFFSNREQIVEWYNEFI